MVTQRLKKMIHSIFALGRKGQLSITNVVSFFTILVIVAVMMSPILDMIEIAQNGTDAITSSLLALLPMFLVLGVIMTLMAYSQTHYAQ